MKNRYIPYGYRIRNGKHCIYEAEAEAIKEVFQLYCSGQSYKSIAEILRTSNHPPYSAKGWNKHHVKRMLENGKYIGGGYPAILSKKQFDAARAVHDKKMVSTVTQYVPSDILWERLRCGECDGRLLRNGSPAAARGITQLRCKNSECSYGIDIAQSKLHGAILSLLNRLIADVRKCPCGKYEQTPETLRLANNISRSIEKPDDPSEATGLIFKGIAARYGSIMEPPRLPPRIQYGDKNRLSEMDWNLFREAVSYISLSCKGIGLTTISGNHIFMEGEDEML
ncbi:MAG: recombinase family protein [Christensenellales bacterium]|jgi:site-specific DNA recombinase